jgi:putative PIN family toxin of toxin-antitoxin system
MERTPPDLRVMLDANILIAGIVWPRWPYEVLQHALRGDYDLVLCQSVIKQARSRVKARFPNYIDQFEQFLQNCKFELVDDPTLEEITNNKDLVRDITDVPIALAAINTQVDFLVSEDKDLTTQDETTVKLRNELKVMVSGTFLRQVLGWKSEDLEKVRGRTWRDLPTQGEA